MIIPNYTFIDYTLLDEQERCEIDLIIEHAENFKQSIDVFNIGELTEKGFGIVKDIQYSLVSGITWKEFFDFVEKLTDIKNEDLQKKSLLELIQCRNYIFSEVARINELESILLSYDPTPEEKEANLEEFEKFGAYMQIRSLAMNDITKIEQVRNIKYSLCLVELRLRTLETEYQKRINEIFKRKNRIN